MVEVIFLILAIMAIFTVGFAVGMYYTSWKFSKTTEQQVNQIKPNKRHKQDQDQHRNPWEQESDWWKGKDIDDA